MLFHSRLKRFQFILLAQFSAFFCLATISAQQIEVDPDNEGATDVVHGPTDTPLTNPVFSPLVLNEDLNIGNTALGVLAISNGGFVANENGTIGNQVDSIGQVRVDGTISQWISQNILTVGNLGVGVLDVTNGAQVVGNEGTRVGNQAGSFGVVTLTGADSELRINSGDFTIGGAGIGTGDVLNGGLVTVSGDAPFSGDTILGDLAGSMGTLTIDGANSRFNSNTAGDLKVGNAGTGFLRIQNGGSFILDNGLGVIGDTATGVGTVTVSGQGSLLEIDFLVVGNDGEGLLEISNGGVVDNEGIRSVGTGAFSQGRVIVDGLGSRWEGRSINVGSGGGVGILEVTNGGAVEESGFGVDIGFGSRSEGVVTVDGFGSVLDVGGPLNIGSGGTDSSASLIIRNGGFVSTERLTVTDDASENAVGRLIIQSGGELHVNETATFERTPTLADGTISFAGDRVYDATGANLQADVNGVLVPRGGVLSGGERLKVEGELTAFSQITIDGGELSAGSINGLGAVDLVRGALELTATDVDVTGTGAFGDTIALTTNQELRVSQTVNVANDGRVDLSGGRLGAGLLENRGVISGSGRIDGQLDNKSLAEVRARSGETLVFTGAGSVNEGEIRLLGTGDATIDFQQGLTNAASGRISGRGSLLTGGLDNEGQLLFSGGISDVTGDVNNTGITDVSGGAVATFYDDFTNEGTLRVVSIGNTSTAAVFFGELSGSGDITGGGDIFALGDLRPGSSPGSVDVDANLFLGSTTFTEIEIAGLEIGEFDQLVIDGDLSVAGDLDVSLLGDFELVDGLEFLIFDVGGTVSGNFDGLLEGDLVGRFGDQDLFISYAAGDGNDIGLFSFSAVPEPSSAGIILIGMVAALVQRRKPRANLKSGTYF